MSFFYYAYQTKRINNPVYRIKLINTGGGFKVYRLVIADDEQEIRQALGNYFPWGEMGFRVMALAGNGKEVLKLIQKKQIDVVLCDIKMPKINGIELAEIVYKQKINTIIIFLSAYRDFDYAKSALQYGVEDYLVKPTKYEELVQVFKRIKEGLDNKKKKEVDSIEENEICVKYNNKKESKSFNDKIILTIKALINKNFQTITLEDAAERVHMSPCYLSKFFKKVTGENFSDYLIKIKMNKAKELLMNIEYRICDVSKLIGYSNSKNFSRAFKNYTGKTPSQFRKGE